MTDMDQTVIGAFLGTISAHLLAASYRAIQVYMWVRECRRVYGTTHKEGK